MGDRIQPLTPKARATLAALAAGETPPCAPDLRTFRARMRSVGASGEPEVDALIDVLLHVALAQADDDVHIAASLVRRVYVTLGRPNDGS